MAPPTSTATVLTCRPHLHIVKMIKCDHFVSDHCTAPSIPVRNLSLRLLQQLLVHDRRVDSDGRLVARNIVTVVGVHHGTSCKHKRQRDLGDERGEIRLRTANHLHAEVDIARAILCHFPRVLPVLIELFDGQVRYVRSCHVNV